MEKPQLLSRVKEIMKHELPMLRSMDFEADTPLLSHGLLDSFAIVTLLAALEAAFQIDLDVESLDIQQFENLNSISELCLHALHKA